ncbi:HD domain-containing protein [Caloramator sp. E03]|uniref:HD domain-containing protein n=1 Tax=Caloramator sp. E03 TaxID=2576307 RepID=UPI001110B415|nr:HD domain-containing protein [Caloramator sp. E03]QCX33688.1 HD domain-containing protein [Caloramator sp. E03]
MDRERAVELLGKYLTSPHLIKHSYAVESVMRALAKKLDPERVDFWGIVGLLHDLDCDVVDWKNDPSLHGPKTIEILKDVSFGNDEMYHAILAHNEATNTPITNSLDRALYASDPITGFITAIALVYPDKKVKSVKVKSIVKRMDEVRFAAGANREAMRSIENLGISFQDFAQISLDAMCEISDVLGL